MRMLTILSAIVAVISLLGCSQQEAVTSDSGPGATTKDGKGAASSTSQQLTINPNYKGK